MLRLVALLLVLAPLTGCSETDPAVPAREQLVGEWDATTANVRVQSIPFGIPVADLASAGDEQTFAFRESGTFSFVFDPAEGRRVSISYQGTTYVSFPLDQTVRLAGDYTVDEGTQQITFSTVASATADDFRLGYRFSGQTLELSAQDPETLARLFGLASGDAAELARIVTGGSVTYSKAG